MKIISCPSIECSLPVDAPVIGRVIRSGFYRRRVAPRRIQRYQCKNCLLYFSDQSLISTYYQKRPDLNFRVRDLLCSQVSQRRAAKLLQVSRTTIARKFRFMAREASIANELKRDTKRDSLVQRVQFDDLITSIHTKCKPASVSLAVDANTRKILGFQVANIPARHPLVEVSRAKYGPIQDGRPAALHRLFHSLKPFVHSHAVFRSDCDPEYPKHVRRNFGNAIHEQVKSRRARQGGFGELKRIGFDPLFSLNHTCAMLRANLNRLARKTWCTSKSKIGLIFHLEIYMHYHNTELIPTPAI